MSSPSASSQKQTEPLLSPKGFDGKKSAPVPSPSLTTLKPISVLRIGLGAACIFAPRWTCALFQYPIPANMAVLARLFGIRDLILGELLLTAEDKKLPDGGKREIKRALWANLAADAVDMCNIGFAVATGTIEGLPAAIFGGGAALLVALEAGVMRGLQS